MKMSIQDILLLSERRRGMILVMHLPTTWLRSAAGSSRLPEGYKAKALLVGYAIVLVYIYRSHNSLKAGLGLSEGWADTYSYWLSIVAAGLQG